LVTFVQALKVFLVKKDFRVGHPAVTCHV